MDPAVFITTSSGLAALAIVADALLGGRNSLGRIPGPDTGLFRLHGWLGNKLNRSDRSAASLRLRGLLGLLALMSVSALLGRWIDGFETAFGLTVQLLLLTLLMGQRTVLELVFGIVTALKNPDHKDAPSRFGATRWGVERLALRFGDGLIANLIAFFTFGFAGLLAFRALSMMMASGAPSGLTRPSGPYYDAPVLLFRLLSIGPALAASLVLALATSVTPGGTVRAFTGLGTRSGGHDLLASRRLLLGTMASAFQFNFRAHPDLRGEKAWIGPEGGKARLDAADLKRSLMAVIVATSLTLIPLLILTVMSRV